MTTLYTAFLPEVMPYVRDCADQVATNAVRAAAIEFCERSLWWLTEPVAIPGVAGTAAYTLTLPAQTRLVQVYQAYYEDRLLTPVDPDNMVSRYGTDWRTIRGFPRGITMLRSTEVMLYPIPDAASTGSGIRVIAAIAPSRDSTGCDDDIYQRWIEVIANGARARLYQHTGAAYYDAANAQVFTKLFRAGCSQASIMRSRAQGRDQQVLRPPAFI